MKYSLEQKKKDNQAVSVIILENIGVTNLTFPAHCAEEVGVEASSVPAYCIFYSEQQYTPKSPNWPRCSIRLNSLIFALITLSNVEAAQFKSLVSMESLNESTKPSSNLRYPIL